jgi:uncharacterized membrane protein YqiK
VGSTEIALFALATVLMTAAAALLLGRSIVRVPQGKALVVNRTNGEPLVRFSDTIVMPIVQRAEVVDLSVVKIEVARQGRDGALCRDDVRADVAMTFYLKVNPTHEDILQVARSVGCARAASTDTLRDLFSARFEDAIRTVMRALTFEECVNERERFKDQILAVIGCDLDGYHLVDLSIGTLQQTGLGALDPANVFDARAIERMDPAYRDEVAAADARVRALEEELAVAKAAQAALLGKPGR